MEQKKGYRPSTLFTVRVWAEENEEGQPEWRGILRYLPAGEEYPFRGWPALLGLLEEIAEGSTGG